MRDTNDLPVYSDVPAEPSEPEQPTLSRAERRAVRMAYSSPTAILPWVGVLAALIWLPLAVLGVWWTVGAWRRGYRGAIVAAIALIAVCALHWFNGHLAKPLF